MPKTIRLEAAALEPLAGRYKLGLLTATVSREGDELSVAVGEETIRLYPESKTRFYARAAELALTFEANDDGEVERFVLHASGQDVPAERQK